MTECGFLLPVEEDFMDLRLYEQIRELHFCDEELQWELIPMQRLTSRWNSCSLVVYMAILVFLGGDKIIIYWCSGLWVVPTLQRTFGRNQTYLPKPTMHLQPPKRRDRRKQTLLEDLRLFDEWGRIQLYFFTGAQELQGWFPWWELRCGGKWEESWSSERERKDYPGS